MVWQYRPEWVTEAGGAGFSVFHATDALSGPGPQAFADDVRAFFIAAFSTIVPAGVSVSFPAEVVRLDTATGELIEVDAISPPVTVAGSAAGPYSAPTGARVRWNTGGIVAGRRVAGTTFIVPLIGAAFQDDGTLAASSVSALQVAAEGYVGNMATLAVVYSRPFVDPEGVKPSRPGTEHLIISGTAIDRAAVLRSRRD